MLQLIAQQFGDGITDGSNYFGTSTDPFTNIEKFISNMIGLLTVLGGVFFILFFVLGAFQWITAGGDSSKIEKARNQMIQGVLGLIIMVAAYAIIGLIGTVVGLDLLRPGDALRRLQPASTTTTSTTPATRTPYEICMESTDGNEQVCANVPN